MKDGDAWEVVGDGVGPARRYAGWRAGSDTERPEFEVLPPEEEVLRELTPRVGRSPGAPRLRPLVETFSDRGEFHLVVRLHYPGMDRDTAARIDGLFGKTSSPPSRAPDSRPAPATCGVGSTVPRHRLR